MDVGCIALNIYHEARYEPEKGKYAVAFVTMNRAAQRHMGICEVVFEPHQFSWTIHALDRHHKLLPKYMPANDRYWTDAKRIAIDAMSRPRADFTHGATFYYADYIDKPGWAYSMKRVGQWGHHVFYVRPANFYVPHH